ncbi:MAG: proteasome-type protease [Rhodocyclaceae bacterium]|jgi:putative proteasome-type protease|nr:proteasome-type protease [Rhodocyclaceae bacterium]
MTYCVAMQLDAGMVFLSDSRTNAGVDHINTFRKMNVFERPGERVLVLMTAGNLAVTQALVSRLQEAMAAPDNPVSLWSVPNLFEAACHVGEVLRDVHRRDGKALKDFGIEFNASLILGGQIQGEAPRLFNIYAAGNFIEATLETPYFQIGESKYGKPIIDRVLSHRTSLSEAAKLALISMDSTIRSNLSVGLPLDLVTLRTDALRVSRHLSVDGDNDYFAMIRSHWGNALRHAFDELPNPDDLLAAD